MEDSGDSEERIAGRQHGFSPAMRCFIPLSLPLRIWAFDMMVINSQQLTADTYRLHLGISHCS
jgi:hypothetical protein